MRTLTVSISDLEYRKFGLKGDNIAFSDFINIIARELSKETLNYSTELAEKNGLSKMTMNDINKEVNAARRNAKNSH